MTTLKIAIEQKLYQLVKEHADDRYCLELLLFFGRHPNTQFSRLAIVHALNAQRLYIERALGRLTNNGVLRRYIGNNVPLYSLTGDESLRSPVLELAKLDWHQRQLVLGQVYPTCAE